MSGTPARYRSLEFPVRRIRWRQEVDGCVYLRAEQELLPYAHRLTDRLLHWAKTTPERTWMAQRVREPDGSQGDWRHVSYGEVLESARSIAQHLLKFDLSVERSVVMLSENDLEHAQLALDASWSACPTPRSPRLTA